MTHPVNRAAFTQWVRQQDDETILGEACDAGGCPVTNYLLAHVPDISFVMTESDAIEVEDRDGCPHTWLNPPWLSRLITRIDSTGQNELIRAADLKRIISLLESEEEMEVSR